MVKQANILVVDDEATVREVVRKYLEHDGFHVIEAESGTQALDCVRDQHPDLIVLDVMLPGADGFTITRALRDADDYAPLYVDNAIPIILLTARSSELDRMPASKSARTTTSSSRSAPVSWSPASKPSFGAARTVWSKWTRSRPLKP